MTVREENDILAKFGSILRCDLVESVLYFFILLFYNLIKGTREGGTWLGGWSWAGLIISMLHPTV